jgi:patatin-like phospholipase/acyl hydrolase
LKQIETLLKQRSAAGDDFRLCDYFDLISGTSTGSIIAAGLALGFSVDRLQELYRKLGQQLFTPEGLRALLPENCRACWPPSFRPLLLTRHSRPRSEKK